MGGATAGSHAQRQRGTAPTDRHSPIEPTERPPTAAERRVLLAALGLRPVPEGAVLDDAGALDWTFLAVYARSRCALPALSEKVARTPAWHTLPDEALALLDDAGLHNELQNRVLLGDLAAVVKVLGTKGIRTIALKGAALLAAYPRLVRLRHTDDIDLWVQPDRLSDADRVLRACGFRDFGRVMAADEGRAHQLPMLVSERGTPLELHRYPPAGRAQGWCAAWKHAERVEVNGTRVAVRAGSRMLLDLCSHVAIHHATHPVMWPRHLVDCATLLDDRRGVFVAASLHASPRQLAALWISRRMLAEVRRPAGGPLSDRMVFPFRGGWRAQRLAELAFQRLVAAPGAFPAFVWPAPDELRRRGYTGVRAWHLHLQRIRRHLAEVRTP